MKNLFTLFAFLLVFQVTSQETISKTQWQKDLRFLQNTIHKDYASLFVKTTKATFDQEVEELYTAIPNLTEHEIIIGFTKIIASFKYGHTGIFFHYNPIKFHHYPFHIYEFKDGIYIEGTTAEYQKALGAKVLKVNEVPIREALEKIKPVVNAENSQYFKAYGLNFIGIPEVLHAQKITKTLQKSVTLTLEKEGNIFTQEFHVLASGKGIPKKHGFVQQTDHWLSARNQTTTPLYLKHLDKVYYSEHLVDEKTMYVRHSRIANDPTESTESFYNRVFDFIETNNNVEKLVIDLRLNGGGNSYLNKPIIKGIIKSKIDKVGSLYVILGRRTYSACQNLVNELDNYTNAIFVGEPTAENVNFWGDSRTVTLPNSKIPVHLSFAWWQGKPQWEYAEWLAPQVAVEMTFEEYVNNEDPVLQTALDFDGTNFIRNPMAYITNLFVSGDVQKLTTEVPKIIQDPKYAFVDFETEFNKIGKRLIEGSPEANQMAVQMYAFLTQLFPKSAITWKNFGDAYLKIGNKEKAKELYRKTMLLDTNGKLKEIVEDQLQKI